MAACACTRCAACALSPRPRSHPPTGTAAQQDASALNTSLHSTSRWVLRRLRARGLVPSSPGAPVLEIGAINTQLLLTPDLRVRAIDLHSSHPSIERSDFFSLPHGGPADVATGTCTPYEVVVCSMVLNCVPDPSRRFEMLVGLRAQLRAGGLAFITLPRSCLAHSWTLDRGGFCECLRSAGLSPSAVEHDASEKVRGAVRSHARAGPRVPLCGVLRVPPRHTLRARRSPSSSARPRCPTPSRRGASSTRASGAAQARALRGAGRSRAPRSSTWTSVATSASAHGCLARMQPRTLVRDVTSGDSAPRIRCWRGGSQRGALLNEAARMRRFGTCSQEFHYSIWRLTLHRSESSTGFKSVLLAGSKVKPYLARLRHGGKMRNLGIFATAEEAALAHARALAAEAPRGRRRHGVRGGPFFRPEEAGPRKAEYLDRASYRKSARPTMLRSVDKRRCKQQGLKGGAAVQVCRRRLF